MSKTASLAFATALLCATTALTSADAFARGGHGGGGGFGGAMKLGAPKPSFKPQVFKAQTIKPRIVKPQVVATHTPKAKIPKVHHDAPQLRKLTRHDITPKITPKIVKPVVAAAALTGAALKGKSLLKSAHATAAPPPAGTKLTAKHFQIAKIDDGKGHQFVAAKKMWFDGKHWWRGHWAWLFIGGVWYYGNSPWTESSGTWTTTEAKWRPECVDCGGTPVKPAIVATPPTHTAAPTGKGIAAVKPPCIQPVQPGAAPADTAAAPQGEDPAAVASGTDHAAQAGAPAATIPDGAPQGCKAVASETTGIDGAAQVPPGDRVAEADVHKAAVGGPANECRQFVPAIGTTVEVPCDN